VGRNLGIPVTQFRFYCQTVCSGKQKHLTALTSVSISHISTLQSEISMWIIKSDSN